MSEAYQPRSFDGALVGRYVLERRLGRGGMAEVYLAEMTGPDGFRKKVALKRVLAERLADPASLARFIDEARLNGLLRHPNVVQTFDWGREADSCFLVMEYIEGTTLENLLDHLAARSEALPLPLALDIGRQIADGLEYAHSARGHDGSPLAIVHRDVKPGNVLIGVHGEVKLADFGIARATSCLRRTATLEVVGTLAYMSPEQASGAKIDRRSDLYAFGAVLFELLTLERLHRLESLGDLSRVVQGLVEDRLRLLAGLPAEVVELVRGLLARDPAARPEEISEVLRRLCRGYPSEPGQLRELVARVRAASTAQTTRETGQAKPSPTIAGGHGLSSTLALSESFMVMEEETGNAMAPMPKASPSDLPALPSTPLNPARGTPIGRVILGVGSLLFCTVIYSAAQKADRPAAESARSTAPIPSPPSPAPATQLSPLSIGVIDPPLERPQPRREPSAAPPHPSRGRVAVSPRRATEATLHPRRDAPMDLSGKPSSSAPARALLEPIASSDEASSASRATPPPMGTLTISSEPYAEVFVDDRYVGGTPLQMLSIAAGEHQLRLVAEDGRRTEMKIAVPPDQETRVPFSFGTLSK